MPERLRSATQRLVGAKQTLKAAEGGRAKVIFLARDAEDRVLSPIVRQAQEHGIEIVYVESMLSLGRMCGIEVGAAAAALMTS
jgi:large subunit ribosomal protein L7A